MRSGGSTPLPRRSARAAGAAWRRHLRATIHIVDRTGARSPNGAQEIQNLWHTGRPTRPNLWSGYDRALRNEWCRAAVTHQRHDLPDRPAEGTYDLDGRYVTDPEGFYCALGEAINGPGGCFGWNDKALYVCLRGQWGAACPFCLCWHLSSATPESPSSSDDRSDLWSAGWGEETGDLGDYRAVGA